jgi:hypothetical protein
MILSLRKQVRQAPVFNPEDLPGMYLEGHRPFHGHLTSACISVCPLG